MAYITEIKRIDVVKVCDDDGLYLRWLNRYGGFDHFLFNQRADTSQDLANISYYKPYQDKRWNERTSTTEPTPTESKKVKKLFYNSLDVDKYGEMMQHFASQSQMFGCDVFVKKYVGSVSVTDFSASISGTVLCTSTDHLLRDGDKVLISDTTSYNGTYVIKYISKDSFAIIDTYVSNQTGVFNLYVTSKHWLRCYTTNVEITNTTVSNTFNVSFDLNYPDY